MKKIMLALLLMACLCKSFAQSEVYNSQSYLENHIAIINTKARLISQSEYVVEITLKDYSGKSALPAGFGSENRIYADDGKGYDLVRADGIFTTQDKYQFKSGERTLESNTIIFDPAFQHKNEIANDPDLQSKSTYVCKFVRVGCPPSNGGNCPACRWWGWSCWEFLPCAPGLEL